jgi:flavorubredoxin
MDNFVKINDSVYVISVNDRRKELFENLWPLPEGVCYNSYVIMDEKIALLDTVESTRGAGYIDSITRLLNGREPEYLIINHMELDHSGEVGEIKKRWPNIKIVGNAKTFKMLEGYYGITDNLVEVADGDELDLGTHKLKFVFTPWVHWPESMVTYDATDKVLFSADGFGKFGALSHDEEWACEARRYYFNICGKYGAPVQALLKKAAMLDINIIAPLHGPILTENLGYYMGLYDTWSRYDVETEGVFIACASIHGGTLAAAERLAEILRAKGAPKVSVADLSRDDMAEAIEDAFRMSKLVVAAASYDGGVFPPMHDFLHHLQIKGYQRRKVAIVENGSWAPCAGRVMHEMLSQMKQINIVEPMVTIWSRMKRADEAALEALADALLTE